MENEGHENHTNSQESHHTIKVKKMDRMQLLTILVSVTLLLTLVNTFGGIDFGGSPTGNVVKNPSPSPSPSPPPPSQARVEVSAGDAPVKGDAKAKVTIIEYSDYECPFCGRFYSQTLPQIDEQYIKTGKVNLVFKDFPLSFHQNAQKAAEAAHCVREQAGDEGYFAMHDLIFENQQSINVENYKKWARTINGVDGAGFDSCLDSGKTAGIVRENFQEGGRVGVQGTPAFFIGGKLISGAQPFQVFQQAIEAEL